MTKRHSIASFLKGGGESHCSLIHGRNIQALTSIDVLVNLLKQIDPVYESSDSIVYAKNTEYFAILFHAPNPRGEGEEERNMALIESYKKVIKHAIQAQCVDKIKDIDEQLEELTKQRASLVEDASRLQAIYDDTDC
jgi:hypothetical protein